MLNDFITEGLFARYVRKVRPICAERPDCPLGAASPVSLVIRVEASPTGGFRVPDLPDYINDVALSVALGR